MPKTILVIEDDPDIRNVVTYTLQDAGYHTLTADNGMSGLITAREQHPDLVLLDLGLPDFDGSEVARRLRSNHDNVPVIVLSAMDSIDRKLNLLDDGANDYLTKPFLPEELLARIKVQLRHRQAPPLQRIGPLAISVDQRQASWNGVEILLSPKEFELLVALARQPGRVYSREELERDVWSNSLQTGSNTVDVHCANLRGKFRAVGANRVVRTVRGLGYALYIDS
ncbi:response regulator transcription factor [Deinococcus peraridilitoris]|uniref:Response regulator with CheY-like receiver domain and winged-helix DNA-binding domain protein n=1 Tax=Deinococcus peraridilitoris (strain DSM 19664 / LMG 22246 / CIP 109416 / KR-200) TaxID=937777 RepID=K9ZZL0_DEIPD|nr:response regulator transcription factor [Deinococcus peraridilitoris]AFZ67041.1 response regulator with CheY-like receiver domain and winged-helix DNA-binding domain protein [Deinococcus peraridilitoris DSM 19664]